VAVTRGSARLQPLSEVFLAVTLATLDTAVTNTALATIAHELQVASGPAIWVINAHQLAMVAALLPFASVGEVRRRGSGGQRTPSFGSGVPHGGE
jgi:MFS family permease